jgi:para-aminobenzoate synthetase/4-amino-4-deoxychorismate lyase
MQAMAGCVEESIRTSCAPDLTDYFLDIERVKPGSFITRFPHVQYGDGWLLFENPTDHLTARTLDEVVPALRRVEEACQQGRYAAGWVAYEAAPAFDSALSTHSCDGPLAAFYIYNCPPQFFKEIYAGGNVDPLLWEREMDSEEFQRKCGVIRDKLSEGESYQVNFTFRLRAQGDADLPIRWAQLAAADPPPYASLFWLEDSLVASLSPELFFELEVGRIRCQPMKGTTRIGAGPAETVQRALDLASSAKERAENLMIVDMIRNDLGRIAEPGSVATTSLFDVDAHQEVLQMTSTVEADCKQPLSEIFKALFPCASIVGAPKVQTSQIIRELEVSPRGVYSGAVGFVLPGGDARFSVAIRTLSRCGVGPVQYGAGSGIVWDSVPDKEWQETLLKTEVLSSKSPEWALIESFRWPERVELPLIHWHLDRLEASARELRITFSRSRAEALLGKLDACPRRVRLRLNRGGELAMDADPLLDPPIQLCAQFAKRPVHSGDPSLRIKTNRRQLYDRALNELGLEEALLWNERGEATEFTKGNLVAEIDGRLVTPPISSGLLPGIYRRHLVESGACVEACIQKEDFKRATGIFRVSSLMGMLPVLLKDVD